MRSTLKHLVKLTAGYSPVTLIGPLSLIFLTPLYTRVLTPADYGVVDVVLTMVTLITTVVNLGLDQALNAFFYDGDLNYQKKLVTSVSKVSLRHWTCYSQLNPYVCRADRHGAFC